MSVKPNSTTKTDLDVGMPVEPHGSGPMPDGWTLYVTTQTSQAIEGVELVTLCAKAPALDALPPPLPGPSCVAFIGWQCAGSEPMTHPDTGAELRKEQARFVSGCADGQGVIHADPFPGLSFAASVQRALASVTIEAHKLDRISCKAIAAQEALAARRARLRGEEP